MKILVIRTGRLGDMVFIAPAVLQIIDNFPDAKITFITSKDGICLYRKFHKNIIRFWDFGRGALGHYLSRKKFSRNIELERFDRIYNFDADERTHNILIGKSPAIHSIYPVHTQLTGHPIQGALQVVSGQSASLQDVDIPFMAESDRGHAKAEQLLQNLGVDSTDFLIGFHPSFSGINKFNQRKIRLHKMWPPERWAKLATLIDQRIDAKANIKILMDLVPQESKLGNNIVNASQGLTLLSNKAPDFERYKAMLQRMNLFVSPDTGPLHLAAALGTRVVALFSRHSPSTCPPFTKKELLTILYSEGGDETGPGLTTLTSERVFNEINAIVAGKIETMGTN